MNQDKYSISNNFLKIQEINFLMKVRVGQLKIWQWTQLKQQKNKEYKWIKKSVEEQIEGKSEDFC